MKKTIFSLAIVGITAFYILLSNQNSGAIIAPSASPPASGNATTSAFTNTSSPLASGGNPPSNPTTPVQTPAPSPAPSPKPTPAPKPKGQYVDGTYTGSAADAYYGMVQVEAVIQGGKIADVKFLQYPNTHSTSVFINQQAMPYLTQEAIQAQSANVNIVSGATDTSMAFQQSLASALSQAKA